MTKTVLLLYGGPSTEHEVSQRSAHFIYSHLKSQFKIRALGFTKEGKPYLQDPVTSSGDTLNISIQNSVYLEDEIAKADVVFSVIHGQFGEDGQIQAICQWLKTPIVGCNAQASALCMDKVLTKILVERIGVDVAPFAVFDQAVNNTAGEIQAFCDRARNELGEDVYIKPARGGSSVGISHCKKEQDWYPAIIDALKYDKKILVEKSIKGRELECAVLGPRSAPRTTAIAEITLKDPQRFYDYAAKYEEDSAIVGLAKDLPAGATERIQAASKKIFQELELDGLARIDFFYDSHNDRLYLNEVNTLPGFTSISQFPSLWAHAGMDAPTLLKDLIQLAT